MRLAGRAGRFTAPGQGLLTLWQVGSRRYLGADGLPDGEQPGTRPKKACPTAVILDTQGVKNTATATGATVGFDAGKLVKGHKHLEINDKMGHVLASRVLPAAAVDGAAAIAFWDEVATTNELLGAVQVVFVDSSFPGVFRQHLAQRCGIRVRKPAYALVRKPNFCIHAWRWTVERTFAWFDMNRRLSKEYDRMLRHANA